MRIPNFQFCFCEQANNSPQDPPKPDIKERIKKLQTDDNELYSHVFGSGVSKGQREINQTAVNALNDTEKKLLREKLAEEKIKRVLREKALELDYIAPDLAVDLLAHKLTLDENMNVVLVTADETLSGDDIIPAVLKQYATKNPMLIRSTQVPGTGTGKQVFKPPNSGQKPIFTRKQLRDGKFYKEHEKEIELAVRERRILEN